MRSKDIILGEEYAYQRGKYYPALRVRALAIGLPRRTSSYGYGSTTRDGVQVMFLDEARGPLQAKGTLKVVPPAHITRPWSEQIPINETREKARIEAEAKVKAELAWRQKMKERLQDPMFADIVDQVIVRGHSVVFQDEAADFIVNAIEEWLT
jgi:hypothetical protein